jgi:hypothetical protein
LVSLEERARSEIWDIGQVSAKKFYRLQFTPPLVAKSGRSEGREEKNATAKHELKSPYGESKSSID